MDAPKILGALILLNRLEDELRALGPRSTRKEALAGQIAGEREKVPPFILAHHDRLRVRGRTSTVPVNDWICRSCFISVPSGLRTKLASRDDICVCENCGAYIYLPTEQEQAQWDADLARKREAALKSASGHSAAPSSPESKIIPASAAPRTRKVSLVRKAAKSLQERKNSPGRSKKSAVGPRKKNRPARA